MAKTQKKQAKPAAADKAKPPERKLSEAELAAMREPPVPPRLKERYQQEVLPALMRQFAYHNQREAPRLDKVIVSMGVGAATQDPKALDAAVRDLSLIAGQKPIVTRAKKSIAAFKVREKMPIGCLVTLRGRRMYEFLDRLFTIALPRIRDFRGLSRESVDGRGNYNLGLREQTIFPEVDLEQVERVQGLNVTIVTTARRDEEALALLGGLGLPLRES